ncbi:MAG: aldo/keto reductase [Anaerolineales bacterium]|nr:aldo/keto reductase [Chloroflexota bacterium]MBL7162878.1 aldo/keto reductase [Anaerolineales bacterium]
MQYINLGNTGLKVSRICLGMMTYGTPKWRDWVLDEEESRPFIQRALELGINFFDTANAYSAGVSEEVTGRALRDFARREEVVIATKVYFPYNDKPNQGGLSRLHIMRAAEDSLRRLGTDYIDLYQIHRWDYDTPIEETLEALHDLVKSGKVRYIGASSMFTWQFAKSLYLADLHGWTRFVSMQNHYNLVYREEEREMIPFCNDQGIGLIPWSPLARGFLAGNRTRDKSGQTPRSKSDEFAHEMYFQDTDFDVLDRAIELAEKRGVTSAQIALAWMLHKPGVTAPIIGASKMRHLEELVAAADIQLSAEEIAYLEEPYQPHPVLGHT